MRLIVYGIHMQQQVKLEQLCDIMHSSSLSNILTLLLVLDQLPVLEMDIYLY